MDTERKRERRLCVWHLDSLGDDAHARGAIIICGSEKRLYEVTVTHSLPTKRPVCEKHLPAAWREWLVESAQRLESWRTEGER